MSLLFLQRDLGGLAHILATADDPSTIPKTIIFSHTKDEVYNVFSFLRTHARHKHVVSMYHASQSEETKLFTQSNFGSAQTELKCLSATIAFGMVCMCTLLTTYVRVYARDGRQHFQYPRFQTFPMHVLIMHNGRKKLRLIHSPFSSAFFISCADRGWIYLILSLLLLMDLQTPWHSCIRLLIHTSL